MTDTKMLEKINEIKILLENNDNIFAYAKLKEIELLLQKDIRISENKKNGKLNAYKAAERILKNAVKKGFADCYHFPLEDEENQVIIDGYHMIVLPISQKLNLEPAPPEIKERQTFNYRGVIPHSDSFTKSVKLPNIADLRAEIKARKPLLKNKLKSNKNVCITVKFDDNKYFNAEYLLDTMEVVGSSGSAHFYKIGKAYGLYMRDDDGVIGICMPIKNTNEDELIIDYCELNERV